MRSPLTCPKLVLLFDADIAEEDGIIQSGEERMHTDPYRELSILIFSHDPATELSRLGLQRVARATSSVKNLIEPTSRQTHKYNRYSQAYTRV